jgi:hypothetical protein
MKNRWLGSFPAKPVAGGDGRTLAGAIIFRKRLRRRMSKVRISGYKLQASCRGQWAQPQRFPANAAVHGDVRSKKRDKLEG